MQTYPTRCQEFPRPVETSRRFSCQLPKVFVLQMIAATSVGIGNKLLKKFQQNNNSEMAGVFDASCYGALIKINDFLLLHES